MNVGKLKKRLDGVSDDTPVIIQNSGDFNVLTAKEFSSPTRGGANSYFGIVGGDEIKDRTEIK